MNSAHNISDGEALDVASSGRPYEVFLSFRGSDTRASFTDHLYTRLIDAGIRTYRDNDELQVGDEIGPELIRGINQSMIAMPIFSKGYAASKWCLKELAHIVDCKKSRGLKVMPIFYDVTPSEVRNQTGDFANAFASHEKFYDKVTIRVWKEALKEVGNLKGWDIQSDSNRQEGKLVKEVTKMVLHELKKTYLIVTDCLVGVDHHVEEILDMIRVEMSGEGILGIYGMGGIGKTTLAKLIYNRLLPQFEDSVFLADVRETYRSKGIVFLQNQLVSILLNMEFTSITNKDEGIAVISMRFSNKKVLFLLDDVDENSQLEGLVGKRDWFGPGTTIIITTRNKSVLDFIQVDYTFEHRGMDSHQALQLFSEHAFRDDKPPLMHVELSEKIVKTTGGLPLALEVVGSLLCGKSMKYWENILNKLEKVPHEKVAEKLSISFESLDERRKHIFLDIACFFIGVDLKVAIHFWDDFELFPEEAIEVLQQMSLIKVQENNLLWMHDQLRDYGRDIIRQENIMDPGKRSRLWNPEEATKIYMSKKATEKIQGICIEDANFREEALAKLCKVRLFWVESSYHKFEVASRVALFNFLLENSYIFYEEILLSWASFPHECIKTSNSYLNCCSSAAPSNFLLENPHIFSEVRWLSWPLFPHECIKTSNFALSELKILNLSYSQFTIDWDGWSQIKMANNLKVLNLTGCKNLVKTPEFSSYLLLEQLILEGCTELVEIDKSISMLKHLVHLNLRSCSSLCELPKELSCMESLIELLIDNTNIVEMPHWGNMVKLQIFSAYGCESLKSCNLLDNHTSLKKLSLTKTQITSIPGSLEDLVNLSELCIESCKCLKKLPETIGGLVSLIQLNISCSGIEELPNSIGNLKNLKLLIICSTPIRELPYTIGMVEKLEEIDATHCKLLRDGLPMLPRSLVTLRLPFIMSTIPDLSNLIKLEQLRVDLKECDQGEWAQREWAPIEIPSPWWIGRLSKAKKLDLNFPTITTLHADLGALSQLTELSLIYCVRLQSIPKLPSNLTILVVSNCVSLATMPNLSLLKKLSTLEIEHTPLIKLEGLHDLESLEILRLHGCRFFEIDGFSENVRTVKISNCEKLKRLPELSKYKKLKELVYSCHNLVEMQKILESLEFC